MAFEAGDWKNYQILIHALKSTAISIGAENLSDEAKNLELAAKNGDKEKFFANHAALMSDYKKVREEISRWLSADTVEEVEEEVVGEDEFSKREKKFFVETCPAINLEVGLKYCMDSKSFFVEMLETFADGKRAEKIQVAFEASDWKNYQILVHALKSTAMSIGAENLSDEAKVLELAAKNNDTEKILANHAKLMLSYKEVREEIGRWLKS